MIVGDGIIVLMVVWLVCLFLAAVLAREPGGVKTAGIGMLVVAIVITVILFNVPRGEPEAEDISKKLTKFDMYSTWRDLIIVLAVVFLLGEALCWFAAYFIQPVYAPS